VSVLFGSYLRADASRLGDVDIAVELRPKETDRGRLRELNDQRGAESEQNGDRFSRMLDRQVWWQMETFRLLKSRSRSISLVDYQTENQFVDRVPHKVLLSAQEEQAKSALPQPKQIRRARRRKDCPF
jgi:predicted nucleotidyltransferase